eukprot:m.217981 g.217981  ORF g.217981 m.217981 type:complete len:1891 (-) comp15896_c0_seq5:51-5723(-)
MASGEVALLEKVRVKVESSADDAELQKNLATFLPPVLLKAVSPEATVRGKVLEVLSLVNKQLKLSPQVKLPLETLLKQLGDANVSAAVKHFTKMYIIMAWPREPVTSQTAFAPSLCQACAMLPVEQQANLLCTLVVPRLGDIKPLPRKEMLAQLGLSSDSRKTLFLDVVKDFFHLINAKTQPCLPEPGTTLLPPPPPGLSRNRLYNLVGKTGSSPLLDSLDKVVKAKLGCLTFLTKHDMFTDEEVLASLLIACADTHDKVAQDAETALKRRLGKDELRSQAYVPRTLYALYLGTWDKPGAAKVAPDSRRSQASSRLKPILLNYLSKSELATTIMPEALLVIVDALGNREALPKVRQAGLLHAHSVIDRGTDQAIMGIGVVLLKQFLKVLDDSTQLAEIQGLAYSALGKLGRRHPSLFRERIDLLERLFEASCEATPEIRSHVLEALSMLRNVFKAPEKALALRITTLLNKFVLKPETHARLLAVQYATSVFPKNHLPSRYVCLLVAADPSLDLRNEAERGLRRITSEIERDDTKPFSKASEAEDAAKQVINDPLPPFKEAVAFIADKISYRMKGEGAKVGTDATISGNLLPFHGPVFARMLVYLRHCLGISSGVFEDEGTNVLETGEVGCRLRKIADHLDLLELSAQMNQETSTPSPVQTYMKVIERGLLSVAPTDLQQEALESLLELVASLPEALSPQFREKIPWLKQFIFSPRETVRDSASRLLGIVASELPAEAFRGLINELVTLISPEKMEVLEKRHGAYLALGFTMSTLTKLQASWRPLAADALNTAMTVLVRGLDEKEEMVWLAACKALGEAGRYASLPFPLGSIDASKDVMEATKPEITIGYIMSKLLKTASREKTTPKAREGALNCIGVLCIGSYPHPFTEEILNGLTAVSKIKSVESQFTVGTALCCLGAGSKSTAAADPWALADAETPAQASSLNIGQKAETSADDKMEIDDKPTDMDITPLDKILKDLISKWVRHPRAISRQAAGVWLVSVLKHCGGLQPVQKNLQALQQAFTGLLSEADGFTQDIASKGIGLIYEQGDDAMKADLVAALVGSLSSGIKGQRVKITDDNREDNIFSEGELGEAPEKIGGGLNTYKELCNLASEMNQPDMIYQFMQLANHNTLWNSRKGAAFGFGQIAHKAQQALQVHLPELIPRLYRYQFDPNPGIRSSMTNIWKTVAPEPVKMVDTYINEILQDLLKNITGNQWRSREACCNAIADVLRGRRWEELEKYIVDLWQKCFRTIDDIKESVRKSGQAAIKRLSKVTIQFCARERGSQGEKAVSVVLPCLIHDGLLSGVDEIRMVSITVLIELAKEAGPALKPHIAEFATILLESLSALESPMLNYISARLSKESGNADRLDNARLAASKASPITECLDSLVKYVDSSVLKDLIPRLTDLIKTGLGSATKSGCARFAEQIATHCGSDIHPYASGLMKSMMSAVKSKSAPVRRDFANAVGIALRSCPNAAVDLVVARCRKMYLNRDNEDVMEASAAVCKAISSRSPDVFNAVGTQLLPLAFVGMYDESKVVSKLFGEVWSDNTAGNEAGIKLYIPELIELILPCFEDRSWNIKKQAAQALGSVAKNAYPGTLDKYAPQLLSVMEEALKGRTWDGKEAMVECAVEVVIALQTHLAANEDSMKKIFGVLMREAKKMMPAYKLSVFKQLAHLFEKMKTLSAPNALGDIIEIVSTVVKPKDDDKMSEDSDEEEKKASSAIKEELKAMSYTMLGKCVDIASEVSIKVHLDVLIPMISTTLSSCTWHIGTSAMKACKSIFGKASNFKEDGILNDPEHMSIILEYHLSSARDSKIAAHKRAAADGLVILLEMYATSQPLRKCLNELRLQEIRSICEALLTNAGTDMELRKSAELLESILNQSFTDAMDTS